MSSWFEDVNRYFTDHHVLFLVYLFGSLAILIILFIIVLIHVIRGTRFGLVIFLNAAILQDLICYAAYAYQYEFTGQNYKTWQFLAFLSFGVYHWALSFTYLRSAMEMRYVFNGNEVP